MTALHLSLCITPSGTTPSWFSAPVFYAADLADGVMRGPSFIADFRQDRYAITGLAAGSIGTATPDALAFPRAAPFSDLFVFARATPAEYLDASGSVQQAGVDIPRFDYRNGYRQLLLEGPATNLFLNAHAPATQTVTVTNGTQYTVSCRGTGSLGLSGAGSGSATQSAPLTFTAASTSLVVTVAGSLSRAQVETGAAASSFIQTTSSAATRSADSCRFSAVAEALMQRSAATVGVYGQGVYGAGRMVGIGTGEELLRLNSAQTAILAGNSLVIATITAPIPVFGLVLGWNGAGRSGAYNGGSVAADSLVPAMAGQIFLGRHQTSAHAQGRYDSVQIWPFRAANASVQAKAMAFA